jgi:hypothetical protein
VHIAAKDADLGKMGELSLGIYCLQTSFFFPDLAHNRYLLVLHHSQGERSGTHQQTIFKG